MISARGPDSASADEPGIDVRALLLRVARQTPRPLHPVSASFGGGEHPRCWPAPNPFPSGLLPSGLGMAKPTIPQARERPVKSIGTLASLSNKQRDGLSVAEVLKEQENTQREPLMASSTAIASDFFAACKTGEGWAGCKTYCAPNATLAAQKELCWV